MDDAERAMAEKIRTEIGEYQLLTDFSVVTSISIGTGIVGDGCPEQRGTSLGMLYLTDHFGVEQAFAFTPDAWARLQEGIAQEKVV